MVNCIGITTINIKVSGWWTRSYLTPSLVRLLHRQDGLWYMWVQYHKLTYVMASLRHLVLEAVSLLEQIYLVYDY